MKAASVERSPRLQRVLSLLRTGRAYTTREISSMADVCAVNSCVAELRANGYDIPCFTKTVRGRKRWFYRLRHQAELDL